MLNFKSWLFNEDKSHSYSCVMANFPNPNEFINWSKKHIDHKDLYLQEGGIEKTPHVTVLYGLHTTEHNEIADLIKNIKPFQIKLGSVSKFAAEKYDVLKIEVKSKELFKLNQLLKRLPYTSKFKEYVPHCTLAYVEKDTCDNLIGDKQFEGKTINVSELVFSPSSGEKTKITLNNV